MKYALLIGMLVLLAVSVSAHVYIEPGVNVTYGNVTYQWQNTTNMSVVDVRSDGVTFGDDDLNITAPSGPVVFDVLSWSPLLNSFTALSSLSQTLSFSITQNNTQAEFITGGTGYSSFYSIGTGIINWYYSTLTPVNVTITIVSTNPSLPLINDGTEELVQITLNSSHYPVDVTFNLYNGLLEDTQGPFTITSQTTLNYTIPNDLSDGGYTLNLTWDYNGSSGGEDIGDFVVAGTTYQCSDGIDNDGDTLVDLNDTGCLSATDDDERYCGDGYVDTNEECDGSLGCRPDCTLSTSSGGSGGTGSYTTPVGDKKSCKVKVVPTTIHIDEETFSRTISIKNNENFAWTPEFTLEGVLGQYDVSPRVDIDSDIGLMKPRDTEQFTVSYRKGIIGTVKAEGAVNIVLFSDECRDIKIPLTMNVTEKAYITETVEYLFLPKGEQWWNVAGNETVVKRINTVMSKPVVEQVGWANSWLMLLAFSLLYIAILWGKVFIRRDDVLNGIVFVFVWIILSVLTTILVNAFIHSILFGG